MNLFVNDKPVTIIKATKFTGNLENYSVIYPHPQLVPTKADDLRGDVLLINPSVAQLRRLFALMRTKKLKKMRSLTFVADDKKALTTTIKSLFKVVKAAGGLVLKDDRMLLMYRLKKWDLPKGKLEKNEKPAEGAVREVEEECNIRVRLEEKICATWHTYTMNGSKILKKTKWYLMTCTDDSVMRPQVEENIEQLIWVDKAQAEILLANSYQSVRFVFQSFFALQRAAMG